MKGHAWRQRNEALRSSFNRVQHDTVTRNEQHDAIVEVLQSIAHIRAETEKVPALWRVGRNEQYIDTQKEPDLI